MKETSLTELRFPTECKIVNLHKIKIENRARARYGSTDEFNLYIESLAASINEIGLIHPPLLRKEDNALIAGECRIRAMVKLGYDAIPIVYREDVSESELKQMELHENTRRFAMSWQEKVILIHETHQAKVKENALLSKTWFQSETGEIFNYSKAHVSNALKLAEYLIQSDPEILAAKKITEAIDILTARAEKLRMAERIKRFGMQDDTPPTPEKHKGGVIQINADGELQPPSTSTTQPQVFQKTIFDLGEMFQCGDCIELMAKMKPHSVDHIVTDIPYGIDMDNLDLRDLYEVRAQHEVEENVGLMEPFLKAAYRVMKDGYLVFWYDLDTHQYLQEAASKVGFRVQKWPLVWCKTNPCQNKCAQFNYTKSTEFAMVLRKGSNTTLLKPQSKNYVICDGLIEKKEFGNHPFIKPLEAWKFILDAISFQGQTILDPFAGQFSSIRAMINMGRTPRAIELVPYHFMKGVEMITSLISDITSNRAEFINNPIANLNPNDMK